jgi:DivIVA domain-containing protein
MMPLTPEEIRHRAFRTGSGRGYDRGEVDAFLAQVADDYGAAIRRLATAAEGDRDAADDVAAEVVEVLRAARESAHRIRQKAQEGADGLFAAATKRADELRARTERSHSEAQAKARHIVEEAEQRALELRTLVEQQQDELIGQAEQRHVALMRYQEQLRDRAISLEALIGEMRAQMVGVEEPTARPRRPAQRRRSLRSKEDPGQEAEPGSTIILEPSTAPVETGGGTSPGPSKHREKPE